MAAVKQPFSDVVANLTECCRKKQNGVFFITTDSNRSAYLTLNDGKIESVHYQNKRGSEALELLRSVEAGTYRFSEGTENAMFRAQPLPETDVILADLSEVASSGSDPVPQDEPLQVVDTAPSSSPGSDYDDELLQLLIEFMGPMASVVFDDARENATTVKSLINKLATEIPDNDQQSDFVERAKQLVRGE